jgi:hypothetical protein
MSIEAMKQMTNALEKARSRIIEAGGSGWKLESQRCTNAIEAGRQAIAEAEKQDHWTHHSAGGNVPLPKGTGHLHTCLGMPKAEQEPVIDKSAAIRIATALGWEPKREWVGLTDEGMKALVEQARKVPVEVPCPDYNERLLTLANDKLRELNA